MVKKIAILSILIFIGSNAFAASKIVDLTKHLSTDNNYKNAPVFDKMKIIAKLIQEGRISSYDKLVTHTVQRSGRSIHDIERKR